MVTLKKKLEAVLFSTGRFISTEELSRLVKKEEKEIIDALRELQASLENNEHTSLVVLNEADMWKLTTREEFGPLVRNVVSETELTKSQLETLAVIAFKYPIKQADLIRIRTNKAYDHLMELEKAGFISRIKYGRSRLIKLTDRFFEYFDLPQEKLKDRFKGFSQLANTIEKKEEDIEKAKEIQRKQAEESKKEAEMERKVMEGDIEIDLVDEKGEKAALSVYDQEEQPHIEEDKEKIGQLEVVSDESEEVESQIEEKTEEIKQEEPKESELPNPDHVNKKDEENFTHAAEHMDEFFDKRKEQLDQSDEEGEE